MYEDIYLRASPEIRVGWRQCFTRICDIADKVERTSNIYLTVKSCRIIVKFWKEVEDGSFSRTLWDCCKAHGISPYPTHFLGEFGLSPEELATQRLDRATNDYMLPQHGIALFPTFTAFPHFLTPQIQPSERLWLGRTFSRYWQDSSGNFVCGAPANARRKRCIFRIHALVALLSWLMTRLSAENAIPCLSQALRNGLVQFLSSTILTASRFQLTDTEGNGIDYLRQCLFSQFPCFFHETSLVAAGEGMVYLKADMERKLMASSLRLEWLGFEQLLVERFTLFRMSCYVRKTEEYDCSNVFTSLCFS